MRRLFTIVGVVGLALLINTETSKAQQEAPVAPVAQPVDSAAQPEAAKKKEEPDLRTTLMGRNMEGQHEGAFVQCDGCSPVSALFSKRGEALLKAFTDNGDLPASLVRLNNQEIDGLLRGMSWTSSILASKDGLQYQRLLAFDADGRGRYLNFLHGAKTYSTLCQYQVDEDLLCLSCNSAPAQCSAIYRDSEMNNLYVAYDPERAQLEIYDWIMKSRWDNERFLAPR